MNQQLALNLGDIETEKSSISTSDIEPKMHHIYSFLGVPAQKVECSVNQYKSSKCDRYYYRVSWRVSKTRMRHEHVPGGSTRSELAKYRAA